MSFFQGLNPFATPTPAAAPTPVGTPGPTPSPTNPANPDAFNPNHTVDPKVTATPTAPLAEFGDLFKVDTSAPKDEDAAFQWNYDPEKLQATVDSLSFVNPQQVTELATSMGVQNPEVLANFMNQFGRTIYQQSLLVNSKMSEQSVNIAEQRFASKVPTHIRNTMVNNEVQELDTNANNPALKPLVDMISAQIAQKNPSFTPAQVAAHAQQYMSGVAQVYAPKPKQSPTSLANPPADFTNFFGSRLG